jgi:hypothetical protein
MNPELEILLPAHGSPTRVMQTAVSLAAQTDRKFSVLLGEAAANSMSEAQALLTKAGIKVRCLTPPSGLKAVEHWNWLHSESRAEWLKLLLPGDQLCPAFVDRLRQRFTARPAAQLIRCNVEQRTDWGLRTLRAPFTESAIAPATFANYLHGRLDWISQSLNVAYRRTAWTAIGGYSTQLPACAALNLNVILALHHGLENVPEPLVMDHAENSPELNEPRGGWVNHWLETWLVLRQARYHCVGANILWKKRWLWAAAFAAAAGRR